MCGVVGVRIVVLVVDQIVVQVVVIVTLSIGDTGHPTADQQCNLRERAGERTCESVR